jgi:hypothetical protein
VIAKTIYTDEEAQRREEEEDLFQHKFEEIESEVLPPSPLSVSL